MKKISIILVNYNSTDDTVECVNSINRSETMADVIIVDNGSNSEGKKGLVKLEPYARIIYLNNNIGFSGGNNIGIKYALEAGYEYIILLNNDTEIDPKMIGALVEKVDEDRVCLPVMYYHREKNLVWYAGGKINKATGTCSTLHKDEKHILEKDTWDNTFATGCCIAIHRDVFEKVGLLSEDYFMYCEDADFSIRLLENGIQIGVIADARLYHKVGGSSGGNDRSSFCSYYMNRNRLYYIRDHRKYFFRTAMSFAIITRILRMLQLKMTGNQTWKSYRDALEDFRRSVRGRSSNY